MIVLRMRILRKVFHDSQLQLYQSHGLQRIFDVRTDTGSEATSPKYCRLVPYQKLRCIIYCIEDLRR